MGESGEWEGGTRYERHRFVLVRKLKFHCEIFKLLLLLLEKGTHGKQTICRAVSKRAREKARKSGEADEPFA